MITRIAYFLFMIALLSLHAEALPNTYVSIPTSSCRWDPTDDAAVQTGSMQNAYWILNSGTSTVEVYCPIPVYGGWDAAGNTWGVDASWLTAGELKVYFQSSATTSARVVQYNHQNTLYSACAFSSGSGIPAVLQPAVCSYSYEVILIQVNVPPGGKLLGIMIDDHN